MQAPMEEDSFAQGLQQYLAHCAIFFLHEEGKVIKIPVDFIMRKRPFSKHQVLSPSLGKKQAKTPGLSS